MANLTKCECACGASFRIAGGRVRVAGAAGLFCPVCGERGAGPPRELADDERAIAAQVAEDYAARVAASLNTDRRAAADVLRSSASERKRRLAQLKRLARRSS